MVHTDRHMRLAKEVDMYPSSQLGRLSTYLDYGGAQSNRARMYFVVVVIVVIVVTVGVAVVASD